MIFCRLFHAEVVRRVATLALPSFLPLLFKVRAFSILSHSEPGTGYHAACNSLIQCKQLKATYNTNLPDISSIYCVKLNYLAVVPDGGTIFHANKEKK